MQNQCEQDIVRDYCLNRKLVKPNTTIWTFVLFVLVIEIICAIVAYSLRNLLYSFGFVFSFSVLRLFVLAIVLLVFLKKICIMLIELYQRYAPDEVRRRCTLMPSCSEYALLALKKENAFIGLYKTYIRLTRRCKGSYSVDYP